MPEAGEREAARLWTPGGFRDDSWRHEEALPADDANARAILPLEAFLALEPAMAASGRVAVSLQPADPVERIVERLAELPLVALAFPAFSDGRSFSKAAMLRTSHGFAGTLRAFGDVLIDQIPLMLRSGFDEFEVGHGTTLERLRRGRVGGIPLHYQPAAAAARAGATYSWRRSSAA